MADKAYVRKTYNKLVRDNVPGIIRTKGEVAVCRALSEVEFRRELFKKVIEEVGELEAADPHTPGKVWDEFADVYETLEALRGLLGVSKRDIEERQRIKRQQRGGFAKRLLLEYTEGPEVLRRQ